MYHHQIYVEMLPAFYEEMNFLSYHVTEHRDQHDQPQKYITVSGMHPEYHLVTIVQGLDSAQIISEREIAPELDPEWEEPECELDGDENAREGETRDLSPSDPTAKLLGYFEAMEAAGAAAFDAALAKATKSGVIRPTISSAVLQQEQDIVDFS